MEELLRREQEVAQQTARENAEEMKLCDLVLGLFTSGFEAMGYQMVVEDVRLETAQLLAASFNTLRWSSEQAIKGYYGPSVSSSRTAWECWLNGAYLNLYPEALEGWKRFETRPKPDVMRKLVAERS